MGGSEAERMEALGKGGFFVEAVRDAVKLDLRGVSTETAPRLFEGLGEEQSEALGPGDRRNTSFAFVI